MTTNQPENQTDRLNNLEATLIRFAEISLQSHRHHGEVLNNHDEILSRLEATATRHDEALSRLEATATRHDEALSRLEANDARHDEALSRLEANDARHDEALSRIEGAISDLTAQQQQLSTTLVEVLRITAAQNSAIANNNRRIEQILEYLFRERPNGRGEGT